MSVNIAKTFSILIISYQNARRLPKHPLDIIIKGGLLQPVASQKLFGVNVIWKERCGKLVT